MAFEARSRTHIIADAAAKAERRCVARAAVVGTDGTRARARDVPSEFALVAEGGRVAGDTPNNGEQTLGAYVRGDSCVEVVSVLTTQTVRG